jgi:hypothetical protein
MNVAHMNNVVSGLQVELEIHTPRVESRLRGGSYWFSLSPFEEQEIKSPVGAPGNVFEVARIKLRENYHGERRLRYGDRNWDIFISQNDRCGS